MRRTYWADRGDLLGRRQFVERVIAVCAPSLSAFPRDAGPAETETDGADTVEPRLREPGVLLNYDAATPREALTKDLTRGEAVWPLCVTRRPESLRTSVLEYVLTGRRTGAVVRLPADNPVRFSPSEEGLGEDIYDIQVAAWEERFVTMQRFPWHFSAYGKAVIPQLRFGVCQSIPPTASDADIEQLVASMKDLHVDAVRMDFLWQSIETRKHEYSFSAYDAIASRITSEGIRLLPILGYGTEWSNSSNDGEEQFHPPEEPLDYQDYVARTVEHFSGAVSIWELWNEPNVPFFWRPQPDSKAYLDLLRAGYIGVKYADPTAVVLLGGLTGNGLDPIVQHSVPKDFLKDLYDSDGGRFFDVINVHPYVHPYEGKSFLSERLDRTRSVAASYGDADKPVWITEIGWPRELGGREVQADWVRTVYSLGIPVFWYNLRDNPFEPWNFGLMDTDHAPQPAYDAYKQLAEDGDR